MDENEVATPVVAPEAEVVTEDNTVTDTPAPVEEEVKADEVTPTE
jgi:hypothetical protein